MPKSSKVTKTAPMLSEEATEEAKFKYKIKPALDSTMEVPVTNGFGGKLVYKSRKTGETIVWDEFGTEQYMELSELRNAKNSNKKFFMNNWFLFDDPEVAQWLGVDQYYKNALRLEDFDGFFEKTPEEITATLNVMSKGQKKSIAFMARQMIANEEIDSIKAISALETGLGIELIEH